MTPVEPFVPVGQGRAVFAEDQPEYRPLPAAVSSDGVVTTEWEPNAIEIAALCEGARVRVRMMTFGQPLQPILVDTIGGR